MNRRPEGCLSWGQAPLTNTNELGKIGRQPQQKFGRAWKNLHGSPSRTSTDRELQKSRSLLSLMRIDSAKFTTGAEILGWYLFGGLSLPDGAVFFEGMLLRLTILNANQLGKIERLS